MDWNSCIEEAKEELGISGWTNNWDEVVLLAKEKYWERDEFKHLKRDNILFSDGKCELCFSTENLTAHHIYYGHNGHGGETMCICSSCHDVLHNSSIHSYGFILQLVLSNITSGRGFPSNLLGICSECEKELFYKIRQEKGIILSSSKQTALNMEEVNK